MSTMLPTTPATLRRTLLAMTALALLAAPAAASTTNTWTNAAGGAWSNPANWSLSRVPAAGDVAVLPALSGAYTVMLDTTPSTDGIQIAAGDPTLDVNGYSLASTGAVDNSGTIVNFTGLYRSKQIINRAGATIQGAYDGEIQTAANDTLVNDGTIIVGPGANSQIRSVGKIMFAGSGKIVLDHSRIYDPNPDPYGTMATLGSGVELTGNGTIDKRLANYGTFACRDSSNIKVNGLLFNHGTVLVQGGSVIRVNRPLVSNEGGAVIRSGPGGGTFSTVIDGVDEWTRGTISLQNGGQIISDGGDLVVKCGTIYDGDLVQTAGGGDMTFDVASWQNIHVHSGLKVTVTNIVDFKAPGSNRTLINDGELVLQGVFLPMIAVDDTVTLGGTGVITLDGGGLGNANMNGSTGTILNPEGMTIQGCGSIYPPFINSGVVSIDCLMSNPGTGRWINRGTLRINRRGMFTINSNSTITNIGRIENNGQLVIEKGGVLNNTRGLLLASSRVTLGTTATPGTILGGRIESSNGGDVYVSRAGTLKDVTLGSTGLVQVADRATLNVAGSRYTNLGLTATTGSGRIATDLQTQYYQLGGATQLGGGALVSGRDVQIAGGALRGIGTVQANLVNGGVMSPSVGAGMLRVQGNYTQLPGGSLQVSLAGASPTQVSHFSVSGTAALAGSLTPTLVNGYVPGGGIAFPDVFTFGARTGDFAQFAAATAGIAAPSFSPLWLDGTMTLVSGSTTAVGDRGAATLQFAGRTTPQGASFVLELPVAATVKGRIYDAAGREVARIADGLLGPGVHTFAINRAGGIGGFASGVYFGRVNIAADGVNEVRTARVVVVR